MTPWRGKWIPACIGLFVSLPGVDLPGQTIEVRNPDMHPGGPLVHGKPDLPSAWTLESGNPEQVRAWNSPADAAIAIRDGATLSQTIELPAIAPAWLEQSKWKLVLAVDVTGKVPDSGRPGELQITLEDASANVLATRPFAVSNNAPISGFTRPSARASSSFSANPPHHAFDGNPATFWHSDYGKQTPGYPHHLTLDFGETRILKGAAYVPRPGNGNGTLKTATLQVSADGQRWQDLIEGEFTYQKAGQEQNITLAKPVECRALRLVCRSEIRGADFASCGELIPDLVGGFDGLQIGLDEPPAPVQRCFLSVDLDDNRLPTSLGVLISSPSPAGVVVDRVHLMYVPETATPEMLGKPNGHNGPDLLGAGSYGFQGRMVHRLPAVSVISVRPGSPADQAGLLPTDLIVGIDGKFLPPGNVAPGFEWLDSSHEALLGRAAIGAFEDGNRGTVILDVLRGEELVHLPVQLRLPREIGEPGFLTHPETLEMLNQDLIGKVLATQSADGSWNRDPIRTSLGGLALLSTGDPGHAPRIKSAANWIMSRNAEPGPGFYWHPAFSGIFLCEYYLASGDQRVLPVIRRMLRMMGSTFHTSKWGTQTFGHGPKGLPYGNKSLVAVMVHVLVFEELARRCGLESRIYETLTPYLESAWSDPATGGHGGMGYNPGYKDQSEFWSRTGLFGLRLNMSGLRPDMQVALAEIMRRRHPWFRNSHAYGEPGGLLGLIGLSQMNREYFEEVLQQYRWWFALAWEPGNGLDFTIPHMGAPYMESVELINNGYAIVTNIHKSNLQILGGQRRNWLDVSAIPVPLSEVMILQGTDGLVRLRCRIPGPQIFYTIDGPAPDRGSDQYDSPFRVQPGSVVRAVAVSGPDRGRVAERGFGYDKTGWQVVSADGDPDRPRACRRAGFAIDGDRRIGWIPDQGEGARGYPYQIVIDMGQPQPANLAGVHFVFRDGAAARIRVQGSNQPDQGFRDLGVQRLEQYVPAARVELNGDRVRYLKFVFDQPFRQDSRLLMVGEIDVR